MRWCDLERVIIDELYLTTEFTGLILHHKCIPVVAVLLTKWNVKRFYEASTSICNNSYYEDILAGSSLRLSVDV
jgi:hypothetical protein